jgi:hypothetical protein
VQVERLGRGPVDGPEEFEPFLMAMALHALADDLAGGDVERGEPLELRRDRATK